MNEIVVITEGLSYVYLNIYLNLVIDHRRANKLDIHQRLITDEQTKKHRDEAFLNFFI